MTGICKSFPGVNALQDVDLQLQAGEILAIVGENGAGKSTLIKTLAGAHLPDSGEIRIEGQPVQWTSPTRARQAGIGVIHQEFHLVPSLSIRENIFLGQSRHRLGIIDQRSERATCMQLFERLGVPLDPEARISSLSIAQQQLVEIAKTLLSDVRILVMDEPTATLTPREVDNLFAVVAELKARGVAIIYISHRLDEVLRLADNVLVLRDGRQVSRQRIEHTNRRELIELMVGRSIDQEFPKIPAAHTGIRLRVDNLCWSDRVRDVSFAVRGGELLGITGLVGAGRTELARLIAGAETPDAGQVEIDGRRCKFRNPAEAIRAGVCLLTEDRKGQGLVLAHSLLDNFSLPNLGHLSSFGLVHSRAQSSAFVARATSLKLKSAYPGQLAGQLSGGNQQKLVLAKWLERNCNIVIFDEPTRGIDIGAKYEIYQLMNRLAADGKAIIMISSELPEVLGMSDRLLVMQAGSISGEIRNPRQAGQEQVMALAAN